jgi:hypothetical protein
MRVWRIIKQAEPTRDDFLSAMAMGREPRTEEEKAIYDGLSMFAEKQQAIDKANAIVQRRRGQTRRVLGDYVVPVDVPDDVGIPLQRTTGSAGHWTVWIDPDIALRFASRAEVEPVAPGLPNPRRGRVLSRLQDQPAEPGRPQVRRPEEPEIGGPGC